LELAPSPVVGLKMLELAPFDHEIAVNVLVGVHRYGPSEPSIQAQVSALQALARKRPSGIGYLLILQKGAMTPNAEARQQVMAAFGDLSGVLRAVAVVMDGGGFWASAVRSTVAVLLIAQARPYEVKIFAKEDEAIPWLARSLQDVAGSVSAPRLTDVVHRLRG
jgi:hypothetical protein